MITEDNRKLSWETAHQWKWRQQMLEENSQLGDSAENLSFIWSNVHFLGCKYTEETENQVKGWKKPTEPPKSTNMLNPPKEPEPSAHFPMKNPQQYQNFQNQINNFSRNQPNLFPNNYIPVPQNFIPSNTNPYNHTEGYKNPNFHPQKYFPYPYNNHTNPNFPQNQQRYSRQ